MYVLGAVKWGIYAYLWFQLVRIKTLINMEKIPFITCRVTCSCGHRHFIYLFIHSIFNVMPASRLYSWRSLNKLYKVYN